jgi:diguanylate cyclase (GGDEF)-like protein
VISIGFIDGKPYHAVTVPIELPEPIAWATFGLPIGAEIAEDIKSLTGLDSTIVAFDVGSKTVYATTLDDDGRAAALEELSLGTPGNDESSLRAGNRWISQLRPYQEDLRDIYVALQLPMVGALADYGVMRNSFVATFGIALLLAIAVAVGLSGMVTRPIGQLVDAARRMADGIYSQPIAIGTKDEFAVLAQGFNSMQEAISNREQDIVHMAHHDSLTGLPTREIIVSDIREAIAETDQLAVINFVLHRFDELASSLGHRTADRLIQMVAGRLRAQLGDGNLLGHLNHQEFVLVIPGADFEQAEQCVLDLQTMLRSGLNVDDANISVQLRAGVALFPDHGGNASELLRCAGTARGHASHHFGSVGVYERGQEDRSLERIRIVGEFPRALESGQLWIAYQPKVHCDSMELCGAEALVRWDHPERGRIPPDVFIEAIERAGGISQLSQWVLEEASRTLAEWWAQGLAISMSVNISADDLIDDYLPAFLKELGERYAIDPGSLTLEVTESSIMHDFERSLAVIVAIRDMGFRISIDDFGTGHSALAQLKRLPVDELKIDQSFVRNMADPRDDAVVRTVIELAHKFDLTVVAEGVEDEESLLRLQQLGCETAQGFYIAKGLPRDEFIDWVQAWEAGEGADIVSLTDQSLRARGTRG